MGDDALPATSKQALLAVTEKEFSKIVRLIETVDAEAATRKRADDTSIKDVVAHRAHWIDLFLGWYADGVAGKEVHFPAKGYRWNDLKRYNADLRHRQANLTWADAVDMLMERNRSLLSFIQGLREDELYGAPMPGARNAWTTGRWAEAAGPSHYRSASKFIRAAMKAAP